MKSIQRLHSDDRVVKASVVHAQWISAVQIHWPASVRLIQTQISHAKSIHCLTCMLYVIWCPIWAISTNNIHQFNRGCKGSEYHMPRITSTPNAKIFQSNFSFFRFETISEPTKRRVMRSTYKMLKIVNSSTVCMNVFCVHVVQHRARHTGGMPTST